MCAKSLQSCPTLWSHRLSLTRLLCPWEFSRQKCWSGLPCPLPGDLSHPGIESMSLTSYLLWQAGSVPLAPPRKKTRKATRLPQNSRRVHRSCHFHEHQEKIALFHTGKNYPTSPQHLISIQFLLSFWRVCNSLTSISLVSQSCCRVQKGLRGLSR